MKTDNHLNITASVMESTPVPTRVKGHHHVLLSLLEKVLLVNSIVHLGICCDVIRSSLLIVTP